MSPYVKTLAKETGQDEETVQKYWEKAKETASEAFNLQESEFDKKHFEYAKKTVLEMLGVDERFNVSEFIKSDKSAKEFIDEAMQTSGDFGIERAVTHKQEPYVDSEEESEEAEEKEPEESKEYEFNNKQSGMVDKEEEKIFAGKYPTTNELEEEEPAPAPETDEEEIDEELKEELEDDTPAKEQ